MSSEEKERIVVLFKKDKWPKQIAKEIGCEKRTVVKYLKLFGLEEDD